MITSNVYTSIVAAIAAGRPLMIWGPPGIGKSAIVKAVADDHGLQLIDLRAAQLEPVDLRGLPRINDGVTEWVTPSFLPTGGKGILFLDELSSAMPTIQAALYQLMLDRQLGDYTLPPGWQVIAAGNRQTDKSVVFKMSAALASRMAHCEAEICVDNWREWAARSGIAEEVQGFIKFRPGLLHDFTPDPVTGVFPCPRSWEMISDFLTTNAVSSAIERDLYSGIIGSGAAIEFIAFLATWRTLPCIDGIINDPHNAIVPTEHSALVATAAALARRATRANLIEILQYLGRLASEYGAFAMSIATTRDEDLMQTNAYARWCTENEGITL